MAEAKGPFTPGGGGTVPLPDAKPGENGEKKIFKLKIFLKKTATSGLIGLLSTSIRKLVKDSGMADALSQVCLPIYLNFFAFFKKKILYEIYYKIKIYYFYYKISY